MLYLCYTFADLWSFRFSRWMYFGLFELLTFLRYCFDKRQS